MDSRTPTAPHRQRPQALRLMPEASSWQVFEPQQRAGGVTEQAMAHRA